MKKFELGPIQKKWIRTLKKYPERQMNGRLGRKTKDSLGLCCLGQGGLIAGTCEWKKSFLNYKFLKEKQNGCTTTLGKSYKSLGLRDRYGSPKRIENFDQIKNFPSLVSMNDNGMSWIEIAAILEVFPEVYFTKSV